MFKHRKSKNIKIFKFTLLIILIITPIFFYWLPRISLQVTNEAIYIFPPSKNKFISDAIYISKRKGIAQTEEIKKFNYKQKYSNYPDAILDLSSFLTESYGKHTGIFKYENNEEKYAQYVSFPIVSMDSNKIATITLPGFFGKTSDEDRYISTVQDFVKKNKHEIKGVIIDLSNNNGGNLDILIASIAQFLPNGTLFNFVDNKNNKFPVKLQDSKILYDDHTYSIESQEKLNIPIVVLGSNITSSSAEILLLAITSNVKQNTFIGQSTGGFLSGREGFKLYDNYYLGLPTRSVETNDGINHKTDKPIYPNIESQDLYNDAKEWLDEITNE